MRKAAGQSACPRKYANSFQFESNAKRAATSQPDKRLVIAATSNQAVRVVLVLIPRPRTKSPTEIEDEEKNDDDEVQVEHSTLSIER